MPGAGAGARKSKKDRLRQRWLCSMSDTETISEASLFLTQTNIQNAVDLNYLYFLGQVSVDREGLGLLKLFTDIEGNSSNILHFYLQLFKRFGVRKIDYVNAHLALSMK